MVHKTVGQELERRLFCEGEMREEDVEAWALDAGKIQMTRKAMIERFSDHAQANLGRSACHAISGSAAVL